jgi:hypothetical protein
MISVRIPRDRAQQPGRQITHALLEGFVQRVAVTLRQMQQANHAGLAFDQRADGRTLVLADDEVSLPMPGLAAILWLERALVDGQHRLLEAWPAPIDMLVRAAVIPAGAKR